MGKKKKPTRKSTRKPSHSGVIRELDKLASSKARLRRMMAETKLHDPPPSKKRPKREPTENLGDRRLGPARARPSVPGLEKKRKEIMRPIDPKGEWQKDVEDLGAEYRATRLKTRKALDKVDAEFQSRPKRPRASNPRRPNPPTRAW